jgi:23S rRNA (guanosine2251-2'-O)-methyltransferase
MRKLRTIEMNRLTLEEFKEAEKLPLIVVLDDVRSLYNVGSVFRSCDAFRVEAVYLCGITATPPNTEIHKTALGGEDSVDWEYFKTTEEAVEKLKQKGYFVYSIEQVEGSTKLQNLPEAHEELFKQEKESEKQEKESEKQEKESEKQGKESEKQENSSLPKGYAVIFGNEVKGVKQNIVDMSDGCLEIPQFGTKHSLNVSVTAGIVVWEFAKLLKL